MKFEKLKKRMFEDRKIFSDFKDDLMKKLYLEYVNCFIVEVRVNIC